MVHEGHINENTTLFLPKEEEWRQSTAQNHELRSIKMILSGTEETHFDPKELGKNGYFKYFKQGCLDLNSGLILYQDSPFTARVRQTRTRAVPVKYIQVASSSCHISPLAEHSNRKQTLFRIMSWIWWEMVNKEVD